MALEKLQGTQIVTWAPPLPQRAFQITGAGVTSDNAEVAGLNTDGVRYGYYVLNTTQWKVLEGLNMPPIAPGEQFQLWSGSGTTFPAAPMFPAVNATSGATIGSASNTNAPDLFDAYTGTETREAGGGSATYSVQDATVYTVVAVNLSSSGSWYVYFSPTPAVTAAPGTDGIITIPKPSSPRYLGQIGHVSGINYTYSIPGGPDQLTCNLEVEPTFRTDALNPGRILTAHRGASCIWEGQLTEPQPAATGWTLTANGVGTYGTNYGAWWKPGAGPVAKSSGWFPDGPIDFAIARGLRWSNRGIGTPAGIYTGPVQNPGSITVTDFMNLLCTGGSLQWELIQPAGAATWPPAPWEVTVYQLPTDITGNPLVAGPATHVQTEQLSGGKWKRVDLLKANPRTPPDLYIINTSPVPRTLVATYNTVILYYQVTADTTATSTTKATAASYGTTYVDVPASVQEYGRMEYYLDISNAGVMTEAQAQQIGLNVLSKYVRVNFAGSFSVMPGQLINPGGFPVDLGLNWGGAVATVQGINAAQGGEVGFSPLTFIIGQYEFDDDSQTATVTPYQSVMTDMDSVVSALYPGKFA